jgi:hypothetical protein
MFHAATHLFLSEKYEESKVNYPLLHNHDVAEALRRSAIAATELLEIRCFGDASIAEHHAIDQFRRELSDFFESPAFVDVDPQDFLVPSKVTQRFETAIAQMLPDVPSVREEIVSRFPGLFAFAFREIGLKANEKVRAVIVESMLRTLLAHSEQAGNWLRDVLAAQQSLQGAVRDVAQQVDGKAAQNQTEFDKMATLLESLSRRVAALDVIVTSDSDQLAKASALVVVRDQDGRELKIHHSIGPKITIGRSGSNTIVLCQSAVSAKHAVVLIQKPVVTVRDLGSRNGTFVDGVRISDTKSIAYGQSFQVGPYFFSVSEYVFRNEPIPPTATIGDAD